MSEVEIRPAAPVPPSGHAGTAHKDARWAAIMRAVKPGDVMFFPVECRNTLLTNARRLGRTIRTETAWATMTTKEPRLEQVIRVEVIE